MESSLKWEISKKVTKRRFLSWSVFVFLGNFTKCRRKFPHILMAEPFFYGIQTSKSEKLTFNRQIVSLMVNFYNFSHILMMKNTNVGKIL